MSMMPDFPQMPDQKTEIYYTERITEDTGHSLKETTGHPLFMALVVGVGLMLGLGYLGSNAKTQEEQNRAKVEAERERTEQARQNEHAVRNKAAWEARAEEERTRQKLIDHATRAENK